VVAAATALGAAELVGIGTGPRYTPVVAVGGVVIDHVPEWGKEFAISVFGTHDKTALQAGTLIILAGIAAGIGILARYRFWAGAAGIGLFGIVGAISAQTRANASGYATLPSLIGAAAGIAALYLLLRAAPRIDGPQLGAVDQETARRRFLGLAAGAVLGAVVLGAGGRWFANRRGVAAARSEVVLPSPSDGLPAEPVSQFDPGVAGAAPFVTSNSDFYLIDTAIIKPQVDPREWSLKIHGMVKNPRTITWNELLNMPMVERYITLACVSNEVGDTLIGNARWLGVPIKGLLEEAQPLAGADQLVSHSIDGFTAGTPVAALLDGRDALLAVGMNGEPLPVKHGFPVRQVVPGLYGYVSATKWLAEWQLTRFVDYDAYWVPRGWSQQAPIKTESRIDTPRRRAATGRVPVAGVAWAQHRGISKVEVQVDDGPWNVATLAAVPSVDTWRLWTWMWDAPAGKHQLRVRATDFAGETQTERPAPPAPNGATGWHTIEVSVS
jgi:DMSO/TMAO reductase YedYZ molybdopterin-dependent catalytic subunit